MIIELFELTSSQKILFYSAMTAITFQSLCIYYFKSKDFNLKNCFFYLFFSAIAYIFYFKLVI